MTDVQLTHKLGFIGYRNHAKKLIDIAEKNNDFEITNIYHPTKRIDDPRITNNLEKLYDCDGVIIASPNSTHFEYIQKLIKNSKCFIFCEKPPVTSLEGIKFLENLAPEDKKRIFFNFQLRFSKINEILKQYLNSEKLGKIIQINIISSMGFAFKEKYVGSWRADGKNNLHNMIENVSIHWIDLMIFNFGKSIGASYFPRLMSNHGSSYDTNSLILKFENGKYDVYRCHVVKYKKVLKNSEVQIVFPCCSTSVEYNKDLIVQRWGVTNAYCKKCNKYHNNPDDLISRKDGQKIDYELFALEDSTDKTEEKEYGYIIKSKSEKLTNANMRFMF